jgi:hypothetical protein
VPSVHLIELTPAKTNEMISLSDICDDEVSTIPQQRMDPEIDDSLLLRQQKHED